MFDHVTIRASSREASERFYRDRATRAKNKAVNALTGHVGKTGGRDCPGPIRSPRARRRV